MVGIDEVGRGCLAGPLVAAAVLLRTPVKGLTDSKLLTRKQREILAGRISEWAVIGLGWVSAQEVDAIGMTAAVSKAMRTAIGQITMNYDEVIIDGNFNYLPDLPMSRTLVKADLLVPAVSAASIIAKVARDDYMREMALLFPSYYFEKHVGYGTRLHMEMLRQFGICELHRQSFKLIRALL